MALYGTFRLDSFGGFVVNSLAFKRFVHTVLLSAQTLEWDQLTRSAGCSGILLSPFVAGKWDHL